MERIFIVEATIQKQK